jgi:hypothetical protein
VSSDRDQAEALRGRELWLARKDLPALGKDEFYLADIIGLPGRAPAPRRPASSRSAPSSA